VAASVGDERADPSNGMGRGLDGRTYSHGIGRRTRRSDACGVIKTGTHTARSRSRRPTLRERHDAKGVA
jgi:hypothetical protein